MLYRWWLLVMLYWWCCTGDVVLVMLYWWCCTDDVVLGFSVEVVQPVVLAGTLVLRPGYKNYHFWVVVGGGGGGGGGGDDGDGDGGGGVGGSVVQLPYLLFMLTYRATPTIIQPCCGTQHNIPHFSLKQEPGAAELIIPHQLQHCNTQHCTTTYNAVQHSTQHFSPCTASYSNIKNSTQHCEPPYTTSHHRSSPCRTSPSQCTACPPSPHCWLKVTIWVHHFTLYCSAPH